MCPWHGAMMSIAVEAPVRFCTKQCNYMHVYTDITFGLLISFARAKRYRDAGIEYNVYIAFG